MLGPHERVSVPEALAAITTGPAFTLGLDALVGSLEPGKFADFAVLGTDPLTEPGQSLKDIDVLGTVVGGHWYPASSRS